MKVMAGLKALCSDCKIVTRGGIKRRICKNSRHKARQGTSKKVKEKGA